MVGGDKIFNKVNKKITSLKQKENAVTKLKQQHLLNFHKNNFLDILPNLHCQVNL